MGDLNLAFLEENRRRFDSKDPGLQSVREKWAVRTGFGALSVSNLAASLLTVAPWAIALTTVGTSFFWAQAISYGLSEPTTQKIQLLATALVSGAAPVYAWSQTYFNVRAQSSDLASLFTKMVIASLGMNAAFLLQRLYAEGGVVRIEIPETDPTQPTLKSFEVFPQKKAQMCKLAAVIAAWAIFGISSGAAVNEIRGLSAFVANYFTAQLMAEVAVSKITQKIHSLKPAENDALQLEDAQIKKTQKTWVRVLNFMTTLAIYSLPLNFVAWQETPNSTEILVNLAVSGFFMGGCLSWTDAVWKERTDHTPVRDLSELKKIDESDLDAYPYLRRLWRVHEKVMPFLLSLGITAYTWWQFAITEEQYPRIALGLAWGTSLLSYFSFLAVDRNWKFDERNKYWDQALRTACFPKILGMSPLALFYLCTNLVRMNEAALESNQLSVLQKALAIVGWGAYGLALGEAAGKENSRRKWKFLRTPRFAMMLGMLTSAAFLRNRT